MTNPSLPPQSKRDRIAEQVRGIVVEAIYEGKRGERAPARIADDVAIKVYALLAAAEREGDTDEEIDRDAV